MKSKVLVDPEVPYHQQGQRRSKVQDNMIRNFQQQHDGHFQGINTFARSICREIYVLARFLRLLDEAFSGDFYIRGSVVFGSNLPKSSSTELVDLKIHGHQV